MLVQCPEGIHHFREVKGINMIQVAVVIWVISLVGPGLVPELRILKQKRHSVHPEAVHTFVHPELEHLLQLLKDGRVPVVEVGLLNREGVVVELLPLVAPLPGRPSEDADPVVGWDRLAVDHVSRVPPDVVVFVAGVPVLRLDEPLVLVARVVGDKVHDDPQPLGLGLGRQALKVLHGAKDRVNVHVVGDVVAEVGHGRLVDGREPKRPDAYRRV